MLNSRSDQDFPFSETFDDPEYEIIDRPTEALAGIIRRVLRQDQVREQAKLAELDRVFRATLGEYANHAWIKGLRRGVLQIAVNNPSVLYEIRNFMQVELIATLRREAPRYAVQQLRLTLCGSGALDDDV
jgi:hypothetical protein